MTLTLYNTLSRKKEDFRPLDADNVRVYVCGPTVYDYAHIGNARPVIVFDMLYRLLRHEYGEPHVKYVRNITDVDDKINARAAQEGVAISEITGKTIEQFHQDIAALGCLPPDIEPRATDHIDEMKAMIETLVEEGHAYVAEGHVLFEVAKMKEYGELSGRSIDDMIAGARVEIAPYKKDPMDFVLWKPSKNSEPGWPSPCGIEGEGRPGWHIECSAMSHKHLDTPFDIHGGGIDLAFPHHENELAQSRSCFGTDKMAGTWMHNGYLEVEGRKMSKSEGNFLTINDLLEKWPGDVLRLTMLMTHYRKPIDWTEKRLNEAYTTLAGFERAVAGADITKDKISEEVIEALRDDLNTPKAISELHALAKKAKGQTDPADAADILLASLGFLGFSKFREFGSAHAELHKAIDEAQVENLITARNDARAAKDWAEADRIRDELDQMNIVIKDGPDGTTWEVQR